MNKDKIIKDLKKRNDSLKMQYEYRNIRCIHLEKENEKLQQENQQLKKQKDELEKENNELQKAYELIDKSVYEFMKQKDDVVEYIKNYDVFKEFSFPLMKKWEENQVKSSIDYQFKESIKKDLLRMLGEIDVKD